jgi:Tti2 family
MDLRKTYEAFRAKLSSNNYKESSLSNELRRQAISVLESNPPASPESSLNLLTNVVRPLFSTTKHAALTSSGRKNVVPPPPSAGRFSDGFYDEESKPWKNGWTVNLLIYILLSYNELQNSTRKAALQDQFHLLVPPILNMIDDADIEYKTDGCHLLKLLCQAVSSSQSEILKRTGLTDVFVGALKTNFMLLPTLTPEDDSLALLKELYPAFRALIAARFLHLPPRKGYNGASQSDTPSSTTQKTSTNTAISADRDTRQTFLDLLMRHGILASYTHASENIKISIFLLTQASDIVSDMGIYSAKYLQQLLPLLHNVLTNPFGTASPDLLLSALGLMKTLVEVCWPRIQEVWWVECLRGCVGCWMVVCEDERADADEELERVKRKLQEFMVLLAGVVGEEFSSAQARLVIEEEDLVDLFVLVQKPTTSG